MANHKSALKRIRKTAARRLHNRYYLKTTKTIIKKIRTSQDKTEALLLLPKAFSLLDKLAKKNIIHRNKAANTKSKLTKLINQL